MKKVKEKYNKETGMFATNSDSDFTEDYKDWLEEMVEKQLTLTHSCESDSELLHTEVFNLANKLAINGFGNEAVKIHQICNGM